MSVREGRKLTTLAVVETVRSERISPHFVRVIVGGEQLDALEHRGGDHWFRLFLPRADGEISFTLPKRIDMIGYLKYLRMPKATRPYLRSYTVREFRQKHRELDIEFVVHGTTAWRDRGRSEPSPATGSRSSTRAAATTGPGRERAPARRRRVRAAGRRRHPARPAPRRHRRRGPGDPARRRRPGHRRPDGVAVHWLVRPHGARPGSVAMAETMSHDLPAGPLSVYVVGEHKLPTIVRRWLSGEKGVPKANATCQAYWRITGH